MFSAIAIVCALSGAGNCYSVSNQAIFPTLKDCQQYAQTALAYAEANNLEVKRIACHNWGAET